MHKTRRPEGFEHSVFGFLNMINFGEQILKAGIHRVVNGLPEEHRF
jgi:hypothetical protein